MEKLIIDSNVCKACGLCIRACPKNLLEFGSHINSGGYSYIIIKDIDACISCGNCAINCPDMAINVYKEAL